MDLLQKIFSEILRSFFSQNFGSMKKEGKIRFFREKRKLKTVINKPNQRVNFIMTYT